MNANVIAVRDEVNANVIAVRDEVNANIKEVGNRVDSIVADVSETKFKVDSIEARMPHFASVNGRINNLEYGQAQLTERVDALSDAE